MSMPCVVFHCLAGIPPFLGDTVMHTMVKQLPDAICDKNRR